MCLLVMNNVQGHLLLVLHIGIILSEGEQRVKREALADIWMLATLAFEKLLSISRLAFSLVKQG